MRGGREAARRAAGGIGPGDHACCAFASDDEQQAVVARYAADALARNERVAYLADRSDEQTVRAYLDDAGLESARHLDSGQLRFVESAGSYLSDGVFDPERQAGLLARMGDEAREDGFANLAVVAEMTWALGDPGLEAELAAYERSVARIFAEGRLHALCQYDRRAFGDPTVSVVARAHDLAIDVAGGGATTVRRGSFSVREEADAPHFALAGEADFFAAPYLEARIAEAVEAAGDEDVVIDAGELRFADVAACRAIVAAAQGLGEGRRLRVERAPEGMRRILSLCDWLHEPSLEVAER